MRKARTTSRLVDITTADLDALLDFAQAELVEREDAINIHNRADYTREDRAEFKRTRAAVERAIANLHNTFHGEE